MPKNCEIAIFTEAGNEMGLGHLSRCTALKDAFKEQGWSAQLLTNNYPDHFPLSDIIIVDSYHLPTNAYERYKSSTRLLVAIDDYQRLSYPTDVIINPALGAEKLNYDADQYRLLCGAEYSLLKKEFWSIQTQVRPVRKRVETILITLGASTPLEVSEEIRDYVADLFPVSSITIASGQLSSLQFAQLLLQTDVAISAGGQTLYELACLGIPTIALQMFDNQRFNVEQWHEVGFIEKAIVPDSNYNYLETISDYLHDLTFEARNKKRQISMKLIDGQGARRAVQQLMQWTQL